MSIVTNFQSSAYLQVHIDDLTSASRPPRILFPVLIPHLQLSLITMTAGAAVVVVVVNVVVDVVVVVVGPKSRSLISPKVFASTLPVNVELSSCETVLTCSVCSLKGFAEEEARLVPELQRRAMSRKILAT